MRVRTSILDQLLILGASIVAMFAATVLLAMIANTYGRPVAIGILVVLAAAVFLNAVRIIVRDVKKELRDIRSRLSED